VLTTDEVARRLGVKPATIYAYVSRGLLASSRNADGKGSLFAEADVEAFAASRRRTVAPGESPPIHTGITLIKDGTLYFRGQDALALATAASYESVATLLWTGHLDTRHAAPAGELLALAEAVTGPLPAAARLADRLRVIVAALAAADPLRFDTAPAAVIATGRTMIATMVAALPLRRLTEPPLDDRFPLAGVLWPRLTADDPTPAGIATLNAAMVLLADHDIAASTLAARVAASTRAHPYAVVGAGLAALDGPLHGAASGLAYTLLAEAVRTGDPMGAISDRLRAGGTIPGFGHRLYPGGDPRALTLLALIRETAAGDACATIDEVAAAVTQRSGLLPNIDFAIAAFALLNNMDPEAGEAIFAVARTAGWIAHALEEYSDRPSRFRPTGHYAGRPPAP